MIAIVTLEEAEAAGLTYKFKPPAAEQCQFCGKSLSPVGLKWGQTIRLWKPSPQRCDCEQATKYWTDFDREQAAEEERKKERERREIMRARVKKLLGESGIKSRFMRRTFANFLRDTRQRDTCYRAAKEYADNWQTHAANGDGLYIEGTNGTGKTHLAAAIALQLLGQGIPVICKTSDDLLQDIKRTFETQGITEREVLSVYRNIDLLIVDDLGKEQCTDWSMSTLYSIFNDRYESMRPTIITTNYRAEDLTQALIPKGGDNKKIVAIISRLRETSRVLTMAWEDFRGAEHESFSGLGHDSQAIQPYQFYKAEVVRGLRNHAD